MRAIGMQGLDLAEDIRLRIGQIGHAFRVVLPVAFTEADLAVHPAGKYFRQALLAAMQQVDAQPPAQAELGMQSRRTIDASQHRRRIG